MTDVNRTRFNAEVGIVHECGNAFDMSEEYLLISGLFFYPIGCSVGSESRCASREQECVGGDLACASEAEGRGDEDGGW